MREVFVRAVNGKSVECEFSITFNEDFNLDNFKYCCLDARFPLAAQLADSLGECDVRR